MPATISRTAYDDKQKEASEASAISFVPVKDAKGKVLNPEVLSKTVQSEQDSTDINKIVDAARKNGGLIFSPNDPGKAISGYFSILGDWHTIKNRVLQGERAFAALPAELRNRFLNPKNLFDFLLDPKNLDEAVKLGLTEAPKPVPTVPTDARAGQPGGPPSGTPANTPAS